MKALLAAFAALAGVWLLINLIGALLVGVIARAVLPGKDKVGWFTTIVIGFVGGILGKLVAFLAGFHRLGWLRGLFVSVLGAIALLIAHRIWQSSKRPRQTPATGA